MKTTWALSASALRDLDRWVGILIHGDDHGLVRDRAQRIAGMVVGDASDPFMSCVLTKSEHGRLTEEAEASSLLGGRRVVRVLDAGDALWTSASGLDTARSSLVVLEGPLLPARSKLRQMVEKSPVWVGIASYPETPAQMAAEIRAAGARSGVTIAPEALDFLVSSLSTDSLRRGSEVEKLFLYASDGFITLEMAELCCRDDGNGATDAVVSTALRGDVAATVRLMLQIGDDGTAGSGVVISLTARVQRLIRVQLEVRAGRQSEEAVRGLMPPVPFRGIQQMVEEARIWTHRSLCAVLDEGRAADIAIKRGGSRDKTIANQLIIAVARRAHRLARQG